MKKQLQLTYALILMLLSLMGCSKKDDGTDGGKVDGFASPQEVFEAMRKNEDSSWISLYHPDDRHMIAYMDAVMARVFVAMTQDADRRKEAERAFEALVEKHDLADRLEFTDNEEKTAEMAAKAFEGVDVPAFLADAEVFKTSFDPSTVQSEPENEDVEEIEIVSMEDLRIDGREATGTVHYSDGTEVQYVFVRSGGNWFLSLSKTQELGYDFTVGLTLKITFNSAKDLENATTKRLLQGVTYDRSMAAKLIRKPQRNQAYLEFMVPSEYDPNEIVSRVRKVSGVKMAEPSFGAEFEEGMETAFSNLSATGTDDDPSLDFSMEQTLLITFANKKALEEASAESLLAGQKGVSPADGAPSIELHKDRAALQAWISLFCRTETREFIKQRPGVADVRALFELGQRVNVRITFENKPAQEEATLESLLEGIPYAKFEASGRYVAAGSAILERDKTSVHARLSFVSSSDNPVDDINTIRQKPGVVEAFYDWDFIIRPNPASFNLSNSIEDSAPESSTPNVPRINSATRDAVARLRQRGASAHTDGSGTFASIILHPDKLTDGDLDLAASVNTAKSLSVGQRRASSEPSRITPAGVQQLSRLPQLEELHIGRLDIQDDHFRAICTLESLKLLSFCRNHASQISASTFTDLALQNLPKLRRLEVLSLGGCQQFTDRGMSSVGKLTRLKTLNLNDTMITDQGITALRTLTDLQELNLYNAKAIADDALITIAGFTALRELNLGNTQITDEGLAQLKSLVKLETLSISSTRVSDTGLQYLGRMTNLKSLNLFGTKVTDKGLAILKKFPNLEHVNVYRSGMTEKGVSELRSFVPRVFPTERPTNAGRNGNPASPDKRSSTEVSAVLLPPNSTWRWFHPVDGIDPATEDPDFHSTFFSPNYNDSSWKSGQDSAKPTGGFGYGDTWFEGVDIGTPPQKSMGKAAYFRCKFATERPHTNLELRCQRDDGIVVYIDGAEVARDNMTEGEEAYLLSAMVPVGPRLGDKLRERTTCRIPLKLDTLAAGNHVMAISLHNLAAPSSDLRIAGITLVENKAQVLTGRWVDGNGGEIAIQQTGDEIIATGKNEKVTRLWSKGTGKLEGNSITMTHFKENMRPVVETGQISQDSSRIDWANQTSWKRQTPMK